jgi:hypothetical protein
VPGLDAFPGFNAPILCKFRARLGSAIGTKKSRHDTRSWRDLVLVWERVEGMARDQ